MVKKRSCISLLSQELTSGGYLRDNGCRFREASLHSANRPVDADVHVAPAALSLPGRAAANSLVKAYLYSASLTTIRPVGVNINRSAIRLLKDTNHVHIDELKLKNTDLLLASYQLYSSTWYYRYREGE